MSVLRFQKLFFMLNRITTIWLHLINFSVPHAVLACFCFKDEIVFVCFFIG